MEAMVLAHSDITLDKLRACLVSEGIAVGRSSAGRFLTAVGLTRKKRRSRDAVEARGASLYFLPR